MASKTPQNPANGPKNPKRGQYRRQVLSKEWTSDGTSYTPGQLHMLCELIGEFQENLESDTRKVTGISEHTLTSPMPNLLDFMEFKLQQLRTAQEKFEQVYARCD